jgi:hypothetical protein
MPNAFSPIVVESSGSRWIRFSASVSSKSRASMFFGSEQGFDEAMLGAPYEA